MIKPPTLQLRVSVCHFNRLTGFNCSSLTNLFHVTEAEAAYSCNLLFLLSVRRPDDRDDGPEQ